MAILLSQRYVENLSDRSPCHARESGESSCGLATFSASKKLPVPFPEAGFRLAPGLHRGWPE